MADAPSTSPPEPPVAGHLGLGLAPGALTFVVAFVFAFVPDTVDMTFAGSTAIALASAVAVWLGRHRPLAGLVAISALAIALPLLRSNFEALDLVIVLVGFQASMRSTLPPWLLAAVCFASLTIDDLWKREAVGRTYMDPSILYPAILTGLAVGLGLQSRRVVAQNAELRTLHDADRRRAVSDERRRIARDVHDIAAHHLSALVVRNKLSLRLGSTEALSEAARFSAETAAEALDSLRQVVRVLSTGDSTPLTPSPSFTDLEDIFRRMETAGLQIERTRYEPPEPSREVQIAVVRILQEALANVLRHRGPGRVWVELGTDGGRVNLTVEDDGPSMAPRNTDDALAGGIGHGGTGHGIIGMRERAAACDGELFLGPSPRGGWRITALIPPTGRS